MAPWPRGLLTTRERSTCSPDQGWAQEGTEAFGLQPVCNRSATVCNLSSSVLEGGTETRSPDPTWRCKGGSDAATSETARKQGRMPCGPLPQRPRKRGRPQKDVKKPRWKELLLHGRVSAPLTYL